MKALVKRHAARGLWLEDVPAPAPGLNDVLIRVHKTGICGTDLHIYNWDAWAVWNRKKYRDKELWIDDTGTPFLPYTHYNVGGNSKFWGSVLYRLRREDFEEVGHADGVSPAWPITYDTLEPYYEQSVDPHIAIDLIRLGSLLHRLPELFDIWSDYLRHVALRIPKLHIYPMEQR